MRVTNEIKADLGIGGGYLYRVREKRDIARGDVERWILYGEPNGLRNQPEPFPGAGPPG